MYMKGQGIFVCRFCFGNLNENLLAKSVDSLRDPWSFPPPAEDGVDEPAMPVDVAMQLHVFHQFTRGKALGTKSPQRIHGPLSGRFKGEYLSLVSVILPSWRNGIYGGRQELTPRPSIVG